MTTFASPAVAAPFPGPIAPAIPGGTAAPVGGGAGGLGPSGGCGGAVGGVGYTREDLVRLGKADRLWAFVPLVAQALGRADSPAANDPVLRYLAATNFAALGLRTLATEQIEALPEAVRGDPSVVPLRQAIGALPDDRLDGPMRVRTCRENVRAMLDAGVHGAEALAAALAEWETRALSGAEVYLRTRDGNIVVQAAPGTLRLRHAADIAGQVESLRLPHEATGPTNIKPYVIESADPPWLLRRVLRATPVQPDGYRVRVSLVQRSAPELLDGLSMADLRAELSTDRLSVHVGDDASQRLERELLSRTDTIVHGHFLGLPARGPESGGAGRCDPPPDQVVQRVVVAQQAEALRLESAVRVEYTGRDAAWYARRFSHSGEPLRVLIPTCRYSTFIRHAAADLAAALEGAGCTSRLLIEPDDCAQLSSNAYLRAFAEFRPDLVVLINYTRANIGAAIPEGVPVVTWVQDAMPHLFDERAGASMGALDFVVGHTHVELYERFNYPERNRLKLPVTASTRKFHDAPVGDAATARVACDVAFITHHSETPRRLHERLCREAAHSPAVVRLFEELRPRIEALVARAGEAPVMTELRATIERCTIDVLGREPDARAAAMIRNQYAFPLADRLVRHRVLEWAAEACARRGWSMRLFGRGWDRHERLSHLAGPELAHGEDLRAAYQSAAATVHASIHWLYHQRVMECALSGGLPLVFLKGDDLSLLRAYALSSVEGASGETACAADSAEAMMFIANLQRLGRPVSPVWGALPHDPARDRACRAQWAGMPRAHGAAFLLGDLAETTFSTPASFEAALARAVERGPRRESLSRGIAARVREHYSTEHAAAKIIELVRDSLGAD
ncbi:MAG: hypothetical protein KF699_12560 [Phycisphaeraceae bacterium]|nr:hypothetical protein [Phycisphaeraceae bacterium]